MAEAWQSDILRRLLAGRHLSFEEARSLFDSIMEGRLGEAQIAAVLVALAAKGERVEEIAGAAAAMRSHAVKVDTDGMDVIDTCGTGGTGLKTFNISTAAAIVAAGAGARVAKHGNRTSTRASGSADVLAELGVNLDADPATLQRCLREANVCFCFAVKHHPAMRFAAPVRKALGVPTVFNVLGPLTNPAGATRQLMGVFEIALVEKIAAVLLALGSVRAMVVHADDGLDEISTTSPTDLAEVKDGAVMLRRIQPDEFGLKQAKLSDLAVTTAKESAQRIRGVLAGGKGADRDIVLINAAAALVVAGQADSLEDGLRPAARSIDSGAALATLEKLIAISNGR